MSIGKKASVWFELRLEVGEGVSFTVIWGIVFQIEETASSKALRWECA